MRPITQSGLTRPEGDFPRGHESEGEQEPVYDAICFHAQQCAEKYLKAWLIEAAAAFPRVHDLEAVADLCLPTLPEALLLCGRNSAA